MCDIEKVIKGLECCLQHQNTGFAKLGCRHDGCKFAEENCVLELLPDFLAMLKAQEPGMVNVTITQSDGWKEGNCPFCGMKVDSFYNWSFCGTCGKGLKWDGR